MKSLLFTAALVCTTLSCAFAANNPQLETNKEAIMLSQKENTWVRVGALAARGTDLEALKGAITDALAAGWSVEEIKEAFVQLYAYAGFPKSLNALSTLMAVAKARGETMACDYSPRPIADSLAVGAQTQTELCGGPVKGPLFDFAPAIDAYLKAHLFGDVFADRILDWRLRELFTVAALAAMDGTAPQLAAHCRVAKLNGVTEAQLDAALKLVRDEVRGGTKTSAFPFGEPNVAYAKYFSGRSWLARLSKEKSLNLPVANVTFEPGCRNNWHSHTGGQMLIAVGGVGYYQARGEKARRLLPGDVVEIPANVEHWHGAAPDQWFSHLAIEANPATNRSTWLEPVSDKDYQEATK